MDNIPSDSYLVKSMAPFAGMIAAFAVVTYGLALISLKWYRLRRTGNFAPRHLFPAFTIRRSMPPS